MPEGPEAHSVADRLEEIIGGKVLTSVFFTDGAKQKGLDNLKLPATIRRVYAKGKKIIFRMSKGYIVTSLGMTGHYSLKISELSIIRFEIAEKIDDDLYEAIGQFFYNDLRKFGNVQYFRKKADFDIYMSSVGRDLLTEEIGLKEYISLMSFYPDKPIGVVLLKQEKLSGIGNYLRSEILYVAKINPYRKVNSLKKKEFKRLYESTKLVMKKSYDVGGFTIRDYFLPDGSRGEYQSLVYDRNYDDESRKIIKENFVDNRTIYYVKAVQPK